MIDDDVRVSRATSDELPRCATTMAEAFHDNAEFRWIIPDEDTRSSLLPVFFGSSLRHAAAAGTVLVVRRPPSAAGERSEAEIRGAAAWCPPGRWRPAWWRDLSNAPRMFFAAAPPQLRRFARRGSQVDRAMRDVHPETPHWYLAGVGVSSDARGTGVGSALIRAGLDRADAQGLPVYLECVRELIPYYERFGFEEIARIDVGDGCPDQVGMWREPVG
ncbi:MAG: GNAT family N-acetyltransferase [Nesterenkonia sp.]|nr:GNAT family N-acetyltransferase [Nesterenkonia sp.]